MKIGIIGANSFIARNIIYELRRREKEGGIRELWLYDYQERHLDGEKGYQQLNVLDMDSVNKINTDVDILFIFVGKTGTVQGFDDYDSFIDINEKALLNILSVYVKNNAKAKIIFPSTRLVYKGKPGKLKEDSEKEFKTIYAANKFSCEQYLKMYNTMYGVRYAVFRICVPYGTMIPQASSYGTAEFMLKKAKKGENISLYGDGSVRRTLTHMEDLCNILIDGAASEGCENDVYNIGGEDYSLREMAERIAQLYSVGVTYMEWPEAARKIESGDTVFDSGKLDNILKYTMKNTFSDWIG